MARRNVGDELYSRIMTTLRARSSDLVDPVHAGAEVPGERPLAAPPGWQPVARGSVVGHG